MTINQAAGSGELIIHYPAKLVNGISPVRILDCTTFKNGEYTRSKFRIKAKISNVRGGNSFRTEITDFRETSIGSVVFSLRIFFKLSVTNGF